VNHASHQYFGFASPIMAAVYFSTQWSFFGNWRHQYA
jgi:hypothetical protein